MATAKKAGTPAQSKSFPNKLVPAAPESNRTGVKKRKRLAKAFTRPLEKTLKNEQLVREKFSMTEGEFTQLVELKQRLAVQGVIVKKSELVRAGLLLLSALDDDDLNVVVAKVPAIG